MDKWQALDKFWNSFGLTAYDENSVPTGKTGIPLPYITYQANTDTFDNSVALSASLWYRSLSWEQISQKSDEISKKIGIGGTNVPYDGGVIWVKRANPFSQRMSDPTDDTIRRIFINIEAEFISQD